MSYEQGENINNSKYNCELAIKKTLAYRSIFKYPLSKYQLKTFLISDHVFSSRLIDKSLEHLLYRKFIKEKDGKYFLPGISIVDWETQQKITKKILEKNSRVFKIIGSLPWTKMIGVTGSIAAYSPGKNADIDLIIITEKNRLWITRFFTTVILKIMGKFPNIDGEKGKICTNIYIDEKDLLWPSQKHNIFIAHDIAMIQPIINKGDTYLNFLYINKWISNYLANFPINKPVNKNNYIRYRSSVMEYIENIFMKVQIQHMKKKKTTEITTPHLIHFNKNDNSQRILKTFEKVLINRNIK